MTLIDGYRQLAGAIVEEQCRQYYEIYKKFLAHPQNPYYIRRRNETRTDLLYFSFAEYVDVDMEAVVQEIERKAQKGDKIGWKQRKI